jgi:ATP-dependent RNA helicase DeaD
MEEFIKLGLKSEITDAISELGFVEPTPVQAQSIPAILESKEDLIALAQTGTGKTAGFGLPIIQQVEAYTKQTQSIILCPTRELCLQIAKDLTAYSKNVDGVKVVAVYGGASIQPQMRDLQRGAQIVVGTPGRTLDLINRGSLKINNIQWLVLDEADEMLNMGFQEDLDAILASTPQEKQTLLFSATMPQGVRQIAQKYMQEHREISVGKRNIGADKVQHKYYVVRAADRYSALKRLADVHYNIYAIVFCRTRRETQEIADKLMQDGYNADALHGDLSQAQRDFVMNRFRVRNLQLLIATDVAARGLDVNDLTHVINYNMPDDPEVYIHRSGRTGRAGKEGVSLVITHSREGRKLRDLEKIVGKKFIHDRVPDGKEVCENRLYNVVDKIENVEVDEDQIADFLPEVTKKLESMDREELIKRFISVEFNRFLEYYRGAKDLNVKGDDRGEGRGRDRDRDRGGRDRDRSQRRKDDREKFNRFYINIGSKHKLAAANMIGLVNDVIGNRKVEIGKIDILRGFSFFEVDKKYTDKIEQGFEGLQYRGNDIKVKLAKADQYNPDQYPNDKDRKKKKFDKKKGGGPKRFDKRKPSKHRKGGRKSDY